MATGIIQLGAEPQSHIVNAGTRAQRLSRLPSGLSRSPSILQLGAPRPEGMQPGPLQMTGGLLTSGPLERNLSSPPMQPSLGATRTVGTGVASGTSRAVGSTGVAGNAGAGEAQGPGRTASGFTPSPPRKSLSSSGQLMPLESVPVRGTGYELGANTQAQASPPPASTLKRAETLGVFDGSPKQPSGQLALEATLSPTALGAASPPPKAATPQTPVGHRPPAPPRTEVDSRGRDREKEDVTRSSRAMSPAWVSKQLGQIESRKTMLFDFTRSDSGKDHGTAKDMTLMSTRSMSSPILKGLASEVAMGAGLPASSPTRSPSLVTTIKPTDFGQLPPLEGACMLPPREAKEAGPKTNQAANTGLVDALLTGGQGAVHGGKNTTQGLGVTGGNAGGRPHGTGVGHHATAPLPSGLDARHKSLQTVVAPNLIVMDRFAADEPERWQRRAETLQARGSPPPKLMMRGRPCDT